MPEWAHLPLILKPDGNGKLSKRDGDRLGFPVFAMNWQDPKTGELVKGFKELGFLPEAFINLLALLGWNDGTEQEIFTLDELVQKFSIKRVHHAGAKFDFEKEKWFNHEWIKKMTVTELLNDGKKIYETNGIHTDDSKLLQVFTLIKDRCTLLSDFWDQGAFFFRTPEKIELTAIQPSWNDKKQLFFMELLRNIELNNNWDTIELEKQFKEIAAANQLKPGELMLPLRIMLVGGKFGPGVFEIASIIGREETIKRIRHTLGLL
jgi:glutamyl-tRNA synthetase